MGEQSLNSTVFPYLYRRLKQELAGKDVATDQTDGLMSAADKNALDSLVAAFSAAGPVLMAQPRDVTVAAGATSQMQVSVLGSGLTYKWERYWNSWEQPNWTGKNTDTLSIPAATAGMNGMKFRCTITGGGWTIVSRTATLTVT